MEQHGDRRRPEHDGAAHGRRGMRLAGAKQSHDGLGGLGPRRWRRGAAAARRSAPQVGLGREAEERLPLGRAHQARAPPPAPQRRWRRTATRRGKPTWWAAHRAAQGGGGSPGGRERQQARAARPPDSAPDRWRRRRRGPLAQRLGEGPRLDGIPRGEPVWPSRTSRTAKALLRPHPQGSGIALRRQPRPPRGARRRRPPRPSGCSAICERVRATAAARAGERHGRRIVQPGSRGDGRFPPCSCGGSRRCRRLRPSFFSQAVA